MAMARLAAEIHLRSERYAKRPKRKFVSASTTEYAWATYLSEWVKRVERVGNLNYPDEARRRRLAGAVVITIAIRRNGTVETRPDRAVQRHSRCSTPPRCGSPGSPSPMRRCPRPRKIPTSCTSPAPGCSCQAEN